MPRKIATTGTSSETPANDGNGEAQASSSSSSTSKPKAAPEVVTVKAAHRKCALVLDRMANDSERRRVLASLTALYEKGETP